MLGVKRMPRPLSESRKPESRRKTSVCAGHAPATNRFTPGFPGQPCAPAGEGAERSEAGEGLCGGQIFSRRGGQRTSRFCIAEGKLRAYFSRASKASRSGAQENRRRSHEVKLGERGAGCAAHCGAGGRLRIAE